MKLWNCRITNGNNTTQTQIIKNKNKNIIVIDANFFIDIY